MVVFPSTITTVAWGLDGNYSELLVFKKLLSLLWLRSPWLCTYSPEALSFQTLLSCHLNCIVPLWKAAHFLCRGKDEYLKLQDFYPKWRRKYSAPPRFPIRVTLNFKCQSLKSSLATSVIPAGKLALVALPGNISPHCSSKPRGDRDFLPPVGSDGLPVQRKPGFLWGNSSPWIEFLLVFNQ